MSRLNIYGQGISTTKKKPCIVATTGNITLSGVTTPTIIDGVNISVGNRILVWQQNSPQENGIYRLKTTQLLLRDYDFIINDDVYGGVEVLVLSGATYSGKTFYLTTSGDITIGSSSLSFNVLAGQNGASGSSGSSGISGTSGLSGSSGTSGETGSSGASGSSGTSGLSGSSGSSGSNAGITSYTNPADNRVITSVSSTSINAEANLTFDGSLLLVNTTSAVKLSVGTTGERPLTPSAGMIRYNTNVGYLEYYDGSSWLYINATNPNLFTADFLVIAGGGSGGYDIGGGGGAGGYRSSVGSNSGGNSSIEQPLTLNLLQSYTITVGVGGTSTTSNGSSNDGTNSVLGSKISIGGGGGANGYSAGRLGGSGGGASRIATVGQGTTIQGTNGGTGSDADGGNVAGGGGGASAVGGNGVGSTRVGGSGGAGLTTSISGTATIYAGGGGGVGVSGGASGSPGSGGSGGGGSAGNTNGTTPGNGTTNRGSGGGGGANSSGGWNGYNFPAQLGGNGGSGIVILSYLNTLPNLVTIHSSHVCNGQAAGTTTAPAPSTARTGYKTYTFTAGSGNISW